MLPSFLMLGGHRCGTTWVNDNLGAHPEAFLPGAKKELHFFDRTGEYEKGIGYYEQYFIWATGIHPRKAAKLPAGWGPPLSERAYSISAV